MDKYIVNNVFVYLFKSERAVLYRCPKRARGRQNLSRERYYMEKAGRRRLPTGFSISGKSFGNSQDKL